ncbi:MAG: DUF1489 family protein [Rhodospirillales bacterium]
MTLHLIKLAVGVDDLAHLEALQAQRLRLARTQGTARLLHLTRHAPRRQAELLAGGSVYWVIRGMIRVRQRLLGFETVGDGDRRRCALVLDPALAATVARPQRAFQGWRYLRHEDAPADAEPDPAAGDGADEMPPTMVAELRQLGLL